MRHWYIQKPTANNCPIGHSGPLSTCGAVFQEFEPTIHMAGCEWIKVYSADDLHKTIGVGVTRYSEVMSELDAARKRISELEKQIDKGREVVSELYAHLLEQGDGFDEKAFLNEVDRSFREGTIDHWQFKEFSRYFARWQHAKDQAVIQALRAELKHQQEGTVYCPACGKRGKRNSDDTEMSCECSCAWMSARQLENWHYKKEQKLREELAQAKAEIELLKGEREGERR
jgi:hypothetical protein